MGNQTAEIRKQSQWEWIENQNGVEIYQHRQDRKLAERRRIVLPGTYTLSEQNKVYAFRANNPFGLVKSYETMRVQDFSKQQDNLGDLCKCSNQKLQIDVYTERISYRLSELPQLTFPESLLFLRQTATAFEVAYQKVGGLHINPELIGITENGEIRAWVNQNWALNRPSHYIPLLKSSSNKQSFDGIIPQLRDESEMICNLISVIEQKNEQGQFPSPFAELLNSKSANFRLLRKFLNDYVTNNNIVLPAKISKNKIDANIIMNRPAESSTNNIIRPNLINPPSNPQLGGFHSLAAPNNTQSGHYWVREESNYPMNSYREAGSVQIPSAPIINFKSELPNIQSYNLKPAYNAYKPIFSQAKFDPPSSSYSQPQFNGLKFNLMTNSEYSQPVRDDKQMAPTIIPQPESPLFSLNQLLEKSAAVNHSAAYSTVPFRPSSIPT